MRSESRGAEGIVGHWLTQAEDDTWRRRTVCVRSIYGQCIENEGSGIGNPG